MPFKITHGLSYHPIYRVWRGMLDRCYLKSDSYTYIYYGGRGIKVCKEWRSGVETFAKWAFHNGYKKGLILDRKNVNGNYEPSNCRFVTYNISQRNKRQRPNKNGYNGITKRSNSQFVAYCYINSKWTYIASEKTARRAAIRRDLYSLKNNLGLVIQVIKKEVQIALLSD